MSPQAISKASTFEMETSVSIHIQASSEKIMVLLTDTPNFTKWNSTIISITGQIRQGETIQLVSKLDPKRTFKLKMTEISPTKMVWKDGFAPFFSGARTFLLSPEPDGSTVFTMLEVFKGLMLPIIKGSLPDFKANFEQYALDLKKSAAVS